MRVNKTILEASAFKYNPGVGDLTLGLGHAFSFNRRSQRFEIDQNPFGDPNLVPMNNIVFSDDFSQLTFDARYQRKHQQFAITAAHEHEKIMFEFFARLNDGGFAIDDHETDQIEIHFEKGRLASITGYRKSKDNDLLDSLNIVGEAGQYSLIKQCPWRKFSLNSIRVDDNRLISRSADEEFVYSLEVQPVILETVEKLVDSCLSPGRSGA